MAVGYAEEAHDILLMGVPISGLILRSRDDWKISVFINYLGCFGAQSYSINYLARPAIIYPPIVCDDTGGGGPSVLHLFIGANSYIEDENIYD